MMSSILWALADLPMEWNTSQHRIEYPARRMSEAGHSCIIRHISLVFNEMADEETKQAIRDADVVVLERLLIEPFHAGIRRLKEQGKRVIVTFDDNYALMPLSGGVSHQTWRGRDGILNEFRQALRLVDKAIVPSRVLVEDYKQFCQRIEYVPNFPDPKLWGHVPRRPSDGNIVIGWGGSSAHDISWKESGLPAALGNLCRKYPRLHIHIGSVDGNILRLLDQQGIRYTAQGYLPIQEWVRVVGTFDIYVVPLAGEYDRRRSDIKCQEAGAASIPWVATKYPNWIGPYDDAMGGLLVKNKSADWEKALSRLIEDVSLRSVLGHQGRVWAEQLMDQVVPAYEEALGIG